MWICLKNGFLSVVRDKKSDQFVVRARVREHLEDNFPGFKITAYTGSDYPYRIFISRKEMAQFLTDEMWDIDYTNFKNEVEDKSLQNFYAAVWTAGIYVLEKEDWYSKYYDDKQKAHSSIG